MQNELTPHPSPMQAEGAQLRPDTPERIREMLRIGADASTQEIARVLRSNYGSGNSGPDKDALYVQHGKLEINGVPHTPTMVRKILAGEALASPGPGAQLRPLPELETTIRAAAVMELQGALTVGVCLAEAKQQLTHGEWMPWLRKMGISPSYAERRMRLAAEIPPESPLASLSYTQAMAVLALPAGEREAFAEANDVQDKSAAEIRRLIRERDQARKAAEAGEENNRSLFRDFERERSRADELAKELETARSAPARTVTVEQVPADYQQLKMQAARHKAEMEEAALAAEEAEQRAARAEAELNRVRREAGGQEGDKFSAMQGAANTFLMAVQLLPYDREELGSMYNRQRYASLVRGVREWCDEMADALEGESLNAEGAVV